MSASLKTTAVAVALLALGCDKLLNLPNDPEYMGGGAGSIGSGEGPWACVDNPRPQVRATEYNINVEVTACNFLKQGCVEQITGLRGRLCSKIDYACTDPLSDEFRDQAGTFSFIVPTPSGQPFDGYLEVTSDSVRCDDAEAFGMAAGAAGKGGLCDLRPECDGSVEPGTDAEVDEQCSLPLYPRSLFFFNPPLAEELPGPMLVDLTPTAAVRQLIISGGGDEVDPSKGIVALTTLDCDFQPAAGIRIRTNKDDQDFYQLYAEGGVFSSSATETDGSGIVGLIGVPEGSIKIFAERDGREIGDVSVQVLPFTMTFVGVGPF